MSVLLIGTMSIQLPEKHTQDVFTVNMSILMTSEALLQLKDTQLTHTLLINLWIEALRKRLP